MRISTLIVALLFAVVTYFLWAMVNRPTEVVPWPEEISGFAFSPFQKGQNAIYNVMPSEEEIREDVELLSGSTRALRTYSSLRSLAAVPDIARDYGMDVVIGIWLGMDTIINEDEIQAGIALANASTNVTSVMVGNETILRGEFSATDLGVLMDREVFRRVG